MFGKLNFPRQDDHKSSYWSAWGQNLPVSVKELARQAPLKQFYWIWNGIWMQKSEWKKLVKWLLWHEAFFIYNSLRFLQIYNFIIYHKENLNGKKLFKNLEWISCPIPLCIQIITSKREIALNSYNYISN